MMKRYKGWAALERIMGTMPMELNKDTGKLEYVTERTLVRLKQIEIITPESDGTCVILLQSKLKGFSEIKVKGTEEELMQLINEAEEED